MSRSNISNLSQRQMSDLITYFLSHIDCVTVELLHIEIRLIIIFICVERDINNLMLKLQANNINRYVI